MTEHPGRKCADCGGTNLRFGTLTYTTFKPFEEFTVRGYDLIAFVCLDCGYVGHFLHHDDVEDIRKKTAKRKPKEP